MTKYFITDNEMKVLIFLFKMNKPVYLGQTKRAINAEYTSISAVLKKFKESGWIRFYKTPNDKLRVYFELTQKGDDVARLLVELKKVMGEK